ncbi:MAG: ABC transporter permease [Chloroflexota bacterium]|jgi:peptide/nickel transport system permease protein|nr:ABC transporter permease [Chloroflexota bacterium]
MRTATLSSASGDREFTRQINRQNRLLRSLRKDWWAMGSLTFLVIVTLVAIFSTWIVPDSINSPNFADRLVPPLTDGYIAGTDQLGRDVWGRMLLGARISLTVGFVTVICAALIGVPIGMLAGYFGGWLDVILMRLVDVQLSFPFILLALTINAILGLGLRNIIITLVIAGWIEYARVARGETLVVREKEFVQAAHLTGCGSPRIFVRHILPNIITPLIVIGTLQVARFIIAEASISFLGFGVQPPTAAWGSMVSEGLDYIFSAWWLITLPGLALAFVALAVNITGDWLRDTLDPRINA